MTDELLTIEEAAKLYSKKVSRAAFFSAAEKGGYLIDMGRTTAVWKSEVREIINSCRREPRDHDCTGGRVPAGPASGSSATQAAPSVVAGRTIAEKLKRSSRNTSREDSAGQVRVLLSK